MSIHGAVKDPYKMTKQEVIESKVEFSLRSSQEFMKQLRENAISNTATRTFSGKFVDIPAGTPEVTATLNGHTVDAEATVSCILAGGEVRWVAEGSFTVTDTYDFDYIKSEAERALDDFLKGMPLSSGKYQGRNLGGQLKTVIMSRVPGTPFSIESEPVNFRQSQKDDKATIGP